MNEKPIAMQVVLGEVYCPTCSARYYFTQATQFPGHVMFDIDTLRPSHGVIGWLSCINGHSMMVTREAFIIVDDAKLLTVGWDADNEETIQCN